MELEEIFTDWLKSKLDYSTYRNYVSILDNIPLTVEQIKTMPAGKLGVVLTKFVDRRYTRYFAVKHLLYFYNRLDVSVPKPRQKQRRHTRKWIDIQAIRDAVKMADDPQIRLAIMLQFETASRISETLALKPNDFDFKEKMVTIGGVKGSEIRSIYISDELVNAVQNYISLYNIKTGEKLFKYSYRKIYYEEKKIFTKLGFPMFSTHWLRFSRGVIIYLKYKDVVMVKELLGHKSLESTYHYLRGAGVSIGDITKREKVEWGGASYGKEAKPDSVDR